MNFKQLESFLWVAELQSFTKAARQMYMSQPAVSFQIKALEEDLEVVLFKRGDKKMILTDAGQLLYSEAKQMFRHYQKIRAGLDDLKGLRTGHLVIGAGTIPGEYIIPLLIGDFKNKYPGIHITLKVSGSGQVERWVREREVDLGITGKMADGQEIECRPWLEDQLVLVVPNSHPWAKLDAIDVTDLQSETMILREQGSGTRQTIKQKLAEHNISLDQIPRGIELGSTRAIITAVEAGLGVSIVSVHAVKVLLELGRLTSVRVNNLNLSRKFYQIWHSQSMAGYAIGAFTDFINSHEVYALFKNKDAPTGN